MRAGGSVLNKHMRFFGRHFHVGLWKHPLPFRGSGYQPSSLQFELGSKLLKGGFIGDYIGEYYRGY